MKNFTKIYPRYYLAIDIFQHFTPFQVLVPAAGIRGFLDASEYGTWLKHFQSISQEDEETKQNVKHFLLAGQVRKNIFKKKRIGLLDILLEINK